MADIEKVTETVKDVANYCFKRYKEAPFEEDSSSWLDWSNALDEALERLKEQQPKTGHWVAKTNVCWHENEDDDATPVFYATLTCSECGKPYSNEVAHTFVDYDEWESAYIPNEPVLNDKRIQIYNKTLEKHIENLKSFRCEWVSCPYCGAKMEKQP